MQAVIEAYEKHKNLKLAANDVGLPWQTVYVHLKRAGVPVVGDKLRTMAETDFIKLVPFAIPTNTIRWQAKFDFQVASLKVDVKAAKPHRQSKRFDGMRWAFCMKKQTLSCDFIVCFC